MGQNQPYHNWSIRCAPGNWANQGQSTSLNASIDYVGSIEDSVGGLREARRDRLLALTQRSLERGDFWRNPLLLLRIYAGISGEIHDCW